MPVGQKPPANREPSMNEITTMGEGRSERFSEIAAEFVRLNVDAIVTYDRCRRFAAMSVGVASRSCSRWRATGLVASLARV
jgi:hypothetical protein